MNSGKLPTVSFIIPTLNAAHILVRCLKMITDQNYPKNKIEIIIADGGSHDETLAIAKKYKAKIIHNPELLHEPGKDRASKVATGDILFFTDADNILQHTRWLHQMVQVFRKVPNVTGFLPQTIPAPDSNSLDRYLGYLSTDPFTWFMYQNAASPRDYKKMYTPIAVTKQYELYQFPTSNHPLIGLTQGFGTKRHFKRGKMGHADDILAAIKLIGEGGTIAYVPTAGIYHYHVSSITNFIHKYRWRVRNNLRQDIKGMGLVHRLGFFNNARKIRMYFFVPYALTLIGPIIDTAKLYAKYKDKVVLWHTIATLIMTGVILWEYCIYTLGKPRQVGTYE